jgi:N-acetylglucosamine-6-sulfatase
VGILWRSRRWRGTRAAAVAVVSALAAAVPASAPAGSPAGPAGPTAAAGDSKGFARLLANGRFGSAASRPNVIVVMTDDQDVPSISVMPNVRRLLAAQGTTFTGGIVAYPLCCPSRATFLTGRYPHNHRIWDNHPPDGGYRTFRKSAAARETLPVWLSRSGYTTAHIGKYMNEYGDDRRTEIPPGWQEWYGSVGGSTYRMWDYTLNENGRLRKYGQGAYQTDVYAAKAVDYIRRRAPSAQPFFLSVSPLAPHAEGRAAGLPGDGPRPAPRHLGRFGALALPRPAAFDEADVDDKPAHVRRLPRLDPAVVRQTTLDYRAQLESLLAVDEAVAGIVDALNRSGELDNTLIVFTSDNGWMRGQHRISRGKRYVYEESIRVPLIVRGPGFARNATSTVPISNIDLAPTVLAAAGARAGRAVDGRPLTALAGQPARDLLIETGPKPSGEPWYTAIRTPRHVYVEHSTGEIELYDLRADPHQLDSLHDDPDTADLRRDLAKRLRALRRCAAYTCG